VPLLLQVKAALLVIVLETMEAIMAVETMMENRRPIQAVTSIISWAAMIVLVPGEMIYVEAVPAWIKAALGEQIGAEVRVAAAALPPPLPQKPAVVAAVKATSLLEAMSTLVLMLKFKQSSL